MLGVIIYRVKQHKRKKDWIKKNEKIKNDIKIARNERKRLIMAQRQRRDARLQARMKRYQQQQKAKAKQERLEREQRALHDAQTLTRLTPSKKPHQQQQQQQHKYIQCNYCEFRFCENNNHFMNNTDICSRCYHTLNECPDEDDGIPLNKYVFVFCALYLVYFVFTALVFHSICQFLCFLVLF